MITMNNCKNILHMIPQLSYLSIKMFTAYSEYLHVYVFELLLLFYFAFANLKMWYVVGVSILNCKPLHEDSMPTLLK